MATGAVMVGGALFNAFTFSGSNALFSLESDVERKKHYEALLKLQTDCDAVWNPKRRERLDYLNEELKRQNHVLAKSQRSR